MGELNVGKREHNKVTTKLQIMEAFIEAVEHHPLDDLKVEDLCKKIGTYYWWNNRNNIWS